MNANFRMKVIPMVLVSASVFLMYRCNSISNEINKSFETVNRSIENSNRFSGDRLKLIYSKIDSNRTNNPGLSRKADSVFGIILTTYNYMDSLKSVLLTADSSGTLSGPSDKLLVNGPTGDSLAEKT